MGCVSTAKVVRATHFAVMLFHGHLYREMGIVSKAEAERATHFAIMLSFLAGSGAVGMNLCAVSSDTDSAVKSHIVVNTKSMLAAQTAPAAIALTDVSRSVSVFPFDDLDVAANQVCGDMSWTPPVSNVGFETYETYLATVAAGSGGVLADSAAVRMNVSAASSDTDNAGKSHIVIYTESALAARTTPAVLAAVFGSATWTLM